MFNLLDTLGMSILADDARDKVPCLSPAVGLALKGLNGVALDVNFIPHELRPKKKKNWALIAAVMLVAFVLLGITSYTISFFVKERFYLAELTERVNALKGRVAEVETMQEEIAAIGEKIESVEKIKVGDPHDLHTLVGSVVENYVRYEKEFCIFPCEPNWMYPICNHYGMTALAVHDRLFEHELRRAFPADVARETGCRVHRCEGIDHRPALAADRSRVPVPDG